MSWLDSLKTMVVEDDPAPTVAVTIQPTSTPTAAPIIVTPVVADGFVSKLRSKINTGGVAEKFEAAHDSLGAISDAVLRMTSCLAVLKTTAGIDVSQIRADYQARLGKLDQEAASFAGALAVQKKAEVDDKQKSVADIDAQLQSLSVTRQQLAANIESAVDKLNRSKAGFDSAVATLRIQIQENIGRLAGG